MVACSLREFHCEAIERGKTILFEGQAPRRVLFDELKPPAQNRIWITGRVGVGDRAGLQGERLFIEKSGLDADSPGGLPCTRFDCLDGVFFKKTGRAAGPY